MEAMYNLRDLLCKQLEDYGKKGELSAAVLERVDMLAHAIKNLDKVIEADEADEYSGNDYRDRETPRRTYDRSMARRRDSLGRYSRNGYSRHGDISDKLKDLMEEAPDDRTRQEIQRAISRMEQR